MCILVYLYITCNHVRYCYTLAVYALAIAIHDSVLPLTSVPLDLYLPCKQVESGGRVSPTIYELSSHNIISYNMSHNWSVLTILFKIRFSVF